MEVTRTLASFVVGSRLADIPEAVRHEGKRALLNWLGCALGGCRDEAVKRALAALKPMFGPGEATLLGRREKADPLHAALINGLGSNILDFDDTHLKTVIHPSVPVASALLPLAERTAPSGADFLHAFILGVEVECRIGLAVSPQHFEAGWHITATTGVFGAAAAAGKLLRLDEAQMTAALGIAATQASGLNEMMGSMCKSYNMGHAARSGLMAALLAAKGFTSSARSIEAARGFAHVLGREPNLERITASLGASYELASNAYKPYPCGIVLHPVIDACIHLRGANRLQARDIERVEVKVHPLTLQLTGRREPATGLEGKLSFQHSAAVALIDGVAGVQQYRDARVKSPAVAALRARVTGVPDAAMRLDEAQVTVVLKDGRELAKHVRYALGSLERPMSDEQLEAKFRQLAGNALAPAATERLLALMWNLEEIADAGALARGAVPSGRQHSVQQR